MTPARTFVMTGATRGIGLLAAAQLARRAPDIHLVLLARGLAGEQIAANLRERLGTDVTVVAADLASLRSVSDAAARVRSLLDVNKLPPLAGIVANAGIQFTSATTVTEDGFEETFAVNVLANHLFIRCLAARLSKRSRITITTSDTHFGDFRHNLGMIPPPVWKDPDVLALPGAFDDPDSAKAGRTAYSTSKLATVYLVHAFARKLGDAVHIVSYNPGFVPGTGLTRNANALERFAADRVLPALTLTPLATTASSAARHLVDIALGEIPTVSGDYVDRGQVVRSSDESYDRKREDQLWESLERLTANAQIRY